MVVTAMFYGSDPQPGDTSKNLELGPIKVNLRTVIIAIESALVVLPVNLLIVALFRKSRRKEFNSSQPKENCCKQNVSQSPEMVDDTDSIRTDTDSLVGAVENKDQETDLHDIQCQIDDEVELHSEPGENSSKNHDKTDLKLQDESSGFFARIRAKFKGSGGSRSNCFPHWCIYVGWTLCILMTLTSAAFTLFYSMMWGKEQSNVWLTTMAISFVQDTLISQPLKVLIVSLVSAIAVASPSGQDDLEEMSAAMGKYEIH